ncbi:hypothetical protein PO909_009281 [Leuciscus waleckii]
MLLLGLFVLFVAEFVGSNNCPANQEISCEGLRSSKGFTYTVPSNITCFPSCKEQEQGWYFQNGTFIVDSTPKAGGQGLSIVVNVTSENLTVRVCENLQWQLNCGTCICNINYTVTDKKHSPAHDPQEEQDGNHGLPLWGIALLGLIGIVGAGAFIAILCRCFRNKKRTSKG